MDWLQFAPIANWMWVNWIVNSIHIGIQTYCKVSLSLYIHISIFLQHRTTNSWYTLLKKDDHDDEEDIMNI